MWRFPSEKADKAEDYVAKLLEKLRKEGAIKSWRWANEREDRAIGIDFVAQTFEGGSCFIDVKSCPLGKLFNDVTKNQRTSSRMRDKIFILYYYPDQHDNNVVSEINLLLNAIKKHRKKLDSKQAVL